MFIRPWADRLRNARFFGLAVSIVCLSFAAHAQEAPPPGFYGHGWGEYPPWLTPSFGSNYEENHTYRYFQQACVLERQPIYSLRPPRRVVATEEVYVCRPYDALENHGAALRP